MEEKNRLFVLNGHEATVCSVAADEDKIVSGGADKVRPDTFVTAEIIVSNGKRSMSSKILWVERISDLWDHSPREETVY